MKQNLFLITLCALLIGGISGYVITNQDEDGMRGMDHSMMTGDHKSEDVPMENMDHGAMMVSSEKEFVAGMIPHHQEAVDTAKQVLERGGSTEEIRMLASNIVEAQETEIEMLRQWYLDWYGEEYKDDNSYQPMMRDLSGLSGVALDKRFLEDMIMHHMGAIMMAESVRPYIEHQEVTNMADAIVTTQTAEVNLMKELLKKI
jgi:uncharacterized protein (DUF305 family)